MHYLSTRGHPAASSFSDILLGGLAPDGGLYLPSHYPQVTGEELSRWRNLSYAELDVGKRRCGWMPAGRQIVHDQYSS